MGNGGSFNASAIVFGNGQFVAWERADSGKPGILTSADGVDWGWAFWPLPCTISAIAYGNGQFVAVGESWVQGSGAVATSTDGTNWILRRSGTIKSLEGITYGNGLFVAVGKSYADGSGSVVTSVDGTKWVERQSWTTNSLEQITFGNGQFVALGNACSLTPDMLTSADGLNWVQRQPGTRMDLSGITYGNGHFLAVGDNGTILESGTIITLALRPNDGTAGLLNLALEGPIGLAYTLQSSTDLATWQNLTNLTTAQPTSVIPTALNPTSGQVFYRAYAH